MSGEFAGRRSAGRNRWAQTDHRAADGDTTPAPAPAPAEGVRQGTVKAGTLLAALAAPASMGVSGPSLALPEAARALGVGPAAAAWLMTAFGLGMAVGTPLLSATAGRRHGPAGVVRASAVLVVLGALLVLLAPTLPLAVAGRALEAAGAAGLNVAAFQLAGRDRSGRTPGVVAIGSAVGGTVGLFVGAAAAGAFGWRAALVLPLLCLPFLRPVLRLASGSPTPGDDTSRTAGKRTGPPLDILRDRRFLAATGLMLALSTVNFFLLYAAPRRVTALTGWSAVETGAASSVAALAGALLSWQLVRAAPGLGPARLRVVLVLGSAGALVLAVTAPWAAAVLIGSGASALVTAGGQGLLTGAATGGLPPARHGLAIGLFNLAFLIGVAAGPALAAFADQTVQFI
ncbi:putative MFS family arabinose efflux permease [Streptomyces sp. PanSC19]|uniref:MFS transporter n=1 Tax=Streptomyces sp. PanSC19 TaxID=1520455 RepID=UPI000F4AC4BF|nr:MFS transporter [Streptomyces sp. PanSC19]ROQ33502.1 putative MFS family arabinose efflux permease [Streptomyces sp. PanSC19]